MGREKDNARKFTEYLDHILAGEEIRVDPAADAELRQALDFARRMGRLRTAPSEQYRARLKAGLLQKLGEQEARHSEARASFWEMFRSHPAWQGAAAALLVIIALTVVWRAGFFQPSITAPETTAPPTYAPSATTTAPATTAAAPAKAQGAVNLVSIDAATDKPTYRPGEIVKIEVVMKNITAGQLTVQDFPPILSLIDADTNQPVYTFIAGKATVVLAPDQTVRYTYAWSGMDFSGRPVTGSYYVELEDLEYNNQPLPLNLNNPVRFQILR
jgi:nucleoid-associated protein YgaU